MSVTLKVGDFSAVSDETAILTRKFEHIILNLPTTYHYDSYQRFFASNGIAVCSPSFFFLIKMLLPDPIFLSSMLPLS